MTSDKRIFLSPPHVGALEKQFVHEAFQSNYIAPLGPQIDEFEKEFSNYTGVKYCLAVNSGTAAMHLALIELGITAGDSVISSTLTFIGSVSLAAHMGAKLIFVDADRESWNIDPGLLEEELGRLQKAKQMPKAVISTDLYGQCSDYDRIFEVCQRYNVPVVIDAAEAMGARYFTSMNCSAGEKLSIHAGKGAKVSIYSFNGNKIMTTSGGGMIASDDKNLIEHARFLSQQARDPFPYYEHSEIGFNYRMSNILGAVGCGQLKTLNEKIQRKKKIFNYYKTHLGKLGGIEFMPVAKYGNPNYWLTVILVSPEYFGSDAETIRVTLEKANIESRPIWKPMHMQPVFCNYKNELSSKKTYPCRVVGGQVSQDLFNRGLCLPSGTQMTKIDLDRVIQVVLTCYKKI